MQASFPRTRESRAGRANGTLTGATVCPAGANRAEAADTHGLGGGKNKNADVTRFARLGLPAQAVAPSTVLVSFASLLEFELAQNSLISNSCNAWIPACAGMAN